MASPRFIARGKATLLLPGAEGVAPPASPAIGLGGLLGGMQFASLSAAVLGAQAAPPSPVKEKRTGAVFPGELEYCAGHRGCPIIAGAGARSKRIVKNLDLYALALFVDRSAVHGALHSKLGSDADAASLARSQKLFDELVNADHVEKTLRLVITSGLVKRSNFLEALEERLAPPLKQAGELAALESFKTLFDTTDFHKGLQINFKAAGSQLTTTIDGKQAGTIANRLLTRSLLDVYLGSDPVSKDAKESIGQGLASMVLV